MRKLFPCLFAMAGVLHGQPAFSHESAPAGLAPRLLPPVTNTESQTNVTSASWVLAQSNPASPPAQVAPQSGATLPSQRTETINYENWILTCREALEGAKKRTCAATVALQRTETGQTVFALTVQLNEQGKLTAAVQTLTGVAIAPGVEIKLEKSAARKLAFESCEPSHCTAALVADTAFLREASAAASVSITLQSIDGKPVNIAFPIKGFDKAYSKMTKG
jgi:invasion protein IalB